MKAGSVRRAIETKVVAVLADDGDEVDALDGGVARVAAARRRIFCCSPDASGRFHPVRRAPIASECLTGRAE
jgi:hypothetical protein